MVHAKNVGSIGSAVLTFVGYKKETDTQIIQIGDKENPLYNKTLKLKLKEKVW